MIQQEKNRVSLLKVKYICSTCGTTSVVVKGACVRVCSNHSMPAWTSVLPYLQITLTFSYMLELLSAAEHALFVTAAGPLDTVLS